MPRAIYQHHRGPAPPTPLLRRDGTLLSLIPLGSALCFGMAPSPVYAAASFDAAHLLGDTSLASGNYAPETRPPALAPQPTPAPPPLPSPQPIRALTYGQLPAAPTMPAHAVQTAPANELLFLEIILNGRPTKHIIPVQFEQGSVTLRPADLQTLGVQIHVNGDRLHLADIPQARFEYHAAEQALSLFLPDHMLPRQYIGQRRERLILTPADTALLLNYDAFVSSGLQNSKTQVSLYLEPRVTGRFGVFSSSGLWRNGPFGGYQRYDTSLRTSHADSATTWEFGDFITRSLAQASAVRLGGVQISRDFAVRPDIITYPMPRVSGRAALPSTVELLVDGRSVLQTQVNAGEFLLDSLPFSTGAGEAQLVVTDIHGNATSANLPFYVTNNLLASGLTDFAISAGFFRENYAVRTFSYGDFAATGSLRHGLSDTITAEIRAEASRDFWLLGGGLQTRLAAWGILSAAAAYSRYNGEGGHHINIGYDYQAGAFSIALRHMRESRHYRDLGQLGDYANPAARQQNLGSVNFSMGRAGNLGLNYAEYRGDNRPVSRYANLNYSVPFASRGSAYLQLGRDLSNNGWTASLGVSLSLGAKGSLTAGIADQSQGQRGYRLDYSRSVPSDGGLGWNVGGNVSEDGSKAWRADMQLRTRPTQFRFGGAGTHQARGGGYQNIWAGAQGGLVFMDGFLVASNQLPSSFAVIDTNGFADIPVRYENQLIGRTNAHGKLFIPNMAPWYAGKIAIDPLDLPADVSVPSVERRIAVEAGRGVHVRFAMNKMQSLVAAVRMADGDYVPAGSQVLIGKKLATHIGWDGLLYLEDISAVPDAIIHITTTDHITCRVTLPINRLTPDNWNLGELSCSPF